MITSNTWHAQHSEKKVLAGKRKDFKCLTVEVCLQTLNFNIIFVFYKLKKNFKYIEKFKKYLKTKQQQQQMGKKNPKHYFLE